MFISDKKIFKGIDSGYFLLRLRALRQDLASKSRHGFWVLPLGFVPVLGLSDLDLDLGLEVSSLDLSSSDISPSIPIPYNFSVSEVVNLESYTPTSYGDNQQVLPASYSPIYASQSHLALPTSLSSSVANIEVSSFDSVREVQVLQVISQSTNSTTLRVDADIAEPVVAVIEVASDAEIDTGELAPTLPVEVAIAPVEVEVEVAESPVAPVQQASAPIQQASAPIQQASAPVQQASAPIEQASAPIQQAEAPSIEVPIAQASAPIIEAPIAQASEFFYVPAPVSYASYVPAGASGESGASGASAHVQNINFAQFRSENGEEIDGANPFDDSAVRKTLTIADIKADGTAEANQYSVSITNTEARDKVYLPSDEDGLVWERSVVDTSGGLVATYVSDIGGGQSVSISIAGSARVDGTMSFDLGEVDLNLGTTFDLDGSGLGAVRLSLSVAEIIADVTPTRSGFNTYRFQVTGSGSDTVILDAGAANVRIDGSNTIYTYDTGTEVVIITVANSVTSVNPVVYNLDLSGNDSVDSQTLTFESILALEGVSGTGVGGNTYNVSIKGDDVDTITLPAGTWVKGEGNVYTYIGDIDDDSADIETLILTVDGGVRVNGNIDFDLSSGLIDLDGASVGDVSVDLDLLQIVAETRRSVSTHYLTVKGSAGDSVIIDAGADSVESGGNTIYTYAAQDIDGDGIAEKVSLVIDSGITVTERASFVLDLGSSTLDLDAAGAGAVKVKLDLDAIVRDGTPDTLTEAYTLTVSGSADDTVILEAGASVLGRVYLYTGGESDVEITIGDDIHIIVESTGITPVDLSGKNWLNLDAEDVGAVEVELSLEQILREVPAGPSDTYNLRVVGSADDSVILDDGVKVRGIVGDNTIYIYVQDVDGDGDLETVVLTIDSDINVALGEYDLGSAVDLSGNGANTLKLSFAEILDEVTAGGVSSDTYEITIDGDADDKVMLPFGGSTWLRSAGGDDNTKVYTFTGDIDGDNVLNLDGSIRTADNEVVIVTIASDVSVSGAIDYALESGDIIDLTGNGNGVLGLNIEDITVIPQVLDVYILTINGDEGDRVFLPNNDDNSWVWVQTNVGADSTTYEANVGNQDSDSAEETVRILIDNDITVRGNIGYGVFDYTADIDLDNFNTNIFSLDVAEIVSTVPLVSNKYSITITGDSGGDNKDILTLPEGTWTRVSNDGTHSTYELDISGIGGATSGAKLALTISNVISFRGEVDYDLSDGAQTLDLDIVAIGRELSAGMQTEDKFTITIAGEGDDTVDLSGRGWVMTSDASNNIYTKNLGDIDGDGNDESIIVNIANTITEVTALPSPPPYVPYNAMIDLTGSETTFTISSNDLEKIAVDIPQVNNRFNVVITGDIGDTVTLPSNGWRIVANSAGPNTVYERKVGDIDGDGIIEFIHISIAEGLNVNFAPLHVLAQQIDPVPVVYDYGQVIAFEGNSEADTLSLTLADLADGGRIKNTATANAEGIYVVTITGDGEDTVDLPDEVFWEITADTTAGTVTYEYNGIKLIIENDIAFTGVGQVYSRDDEGAINFLGSGNTLIDTREKLLSLAEIDDQKTINLAFNGETGESVLIGLASTFSDGGNNEDNKLLRYENIDGTFTYVLAIENDLDLEFIIVTAPADFTVYGDSNLERTTRTLEYDDGLKSGQFYQKTLSGSEDITLSFEEVSIVTSSNIAETRIMGGDGTNTVTLEKPNGAEWVVTVGSGTEAGFNVYTNGIVKVLIADTITNIVLATAGTVGASGVNDGGATGDAGEPAPQPEFSIETSSETSETEEKPQTARSESSPAPEGFATGQQAPDSGQNLALPVDLADGLTDTLTLSFAEIVADVANNSIASYTVLIDDSDADDTIILPTDIDGVIWARSVDGLTNIATYTATGVDPDNDGTNEDVTIDVDGDGRVSGNIDFDLPDGTLDLSGAGLGAVKTTLDVAQIINEVAVDGTTANLYELTVTGDSGDTVILDDNVEISTSSGNTIYTYTSGSDTVVVTIADADGITVEGATPIAPPPPVAPTYTESGHDLTSGAIDVSSSSQADTVTISLAEILAEITGTGSGGNTFNLAITGDSGDVVYLPTGFANWVRVGNTYTYTGDIDAVAVTNLGVTSLTSSETEIETVTITINGDVSILGAVQYDLSGGTIDVTGMGDNVLSGAIRVSKVITDIAQDASHVFNLAITGDAGDVVYLPIRHAGSELTWQITKGASTSVYVANIGDVDDADTDDESLSITIDNDVTVRGNFDFDSNNTIDLTSGSINTLTIDTAEIIANIAVVNNKYSVTIIGDANDKVTLPSGAWTRVSVDATNSIYEQAIQGSSDSVAITISNAVKVIGELNYDLTTGANTLNLDIGREIAFGTEVNDTFTITIDGDSGDSVVLPGDGWVLTTDANNNIYTKNLGDIDNRKQVDGTFSTSESNEESIVVMIANEITSVTAEPPAPPVVPYVAYTATYDLTGSGADTLTLNIDKILADIPQGADNTFTMTITAEMEDTIVLGEGWTEDATGANRIYTRLLGNIDADSANEAVVITVMPVTAGQHATVDFTASATSEKPNLATHDYSASQGNLSISIHNILSTIAPQGNSYHVSVIGGSDDTVNLPGAGWTLDDTGARDVYTRQVRGSSTTDTADDEFVVYTIDKAVNVVRLDLRHFSPTDFSEAFNLEFGTRDYMFLSLGHFADDGAIKSTVTANAEGRYVVTITGDNNDKIILPKEVAFWQREAVDGDFSVWKISYNDIDLVVKKAIDIVGLDDDNAYTVNDDGSIDFVGSARIDSLSDLLLFAEIDAQKTINLVFSGEGISATIARANAFTEAAGNNDNPLIVTDNVDSTKTYRLKIEGDADLEYIVITAPDDFDVFGTTGNKRDARTLDYDEELDSHYGVTLDPGESIALSKLELSTPTETGSYKTIITGGDGTSIVTLYGAEGEWTIDTTPSGFTTYTRLLTVSTSVPQQTVTVEIADSITTDVAYGGTAGGSSGESAPVQDPQHQFSIQQEIFKDGEESNSETPQEQSHAPDMDTGFDAFATPDVPDIG